MSDERGKETNKSPKKQEQEEREQQPTPAKARGDSGSTKAGNRSKPAPN